MSDFSDVGFIVETEEDFRLLIHQASQQAEIIKGSNGKYILYSDPSGAELWMQLNNKKEFVGANPHFKGKSRRLVCLTATIERRESELDGAYHAWANPGKVNDPESGDYPFVFDVPDFRTIGTIETPKNLEIQLTGFARSLDYFSDEKAYDDSQDAEIKFAYQSFIPSGLFAAVDSDSEPAGAFGLFTGFIKEWERKTNVLTGAYFYWMLVDTLGGEIDVVADYRFFAEEPKVNGLVKGEFWLSGRVLDTPQFTPSKKGVFGRFFGKN